MQTVSQMNLMYNMLTKMCYIGVLVLRETSVKSILVEELHIMDGTCAD